jgi:PHD/YefM family antitoxin component YafN of YafNO toxin-antitoxin module
MATGVQYVGPYIDEQVEHVGITRLRSLNVSSLRDFDKTLVIQDNDKPLAVLLSYEQFLAMQKQLVSVLATLEVFTNGTEAERFKTGLADVQAGKVKPLAKIRETLKEEKRAGSK